MEHSVTTEILPQEATSDNSILGDPTDALRELFQAMLQGVMERDVDATLGAARYQRHEDRQDTRNGYRPRRFDTRMGTLDLAIPRMRETTYMPPFLERRERSEKAIISLVQEAYINGISTRKMEKLVAELGITSLSKAQVSEYTQEIDELVTAFRHRPLEGRYPYIMFDAIYEKIRVDRVVQSQAAVVAYGITDDGKRELIGLEIFNTESFESWSTFFRGLLERGLQGVRLVISDAHAGLVKAIQTVFLGASWQRCKVHFMRNMLAPVPKNRKDEFAADMKRMFHQDQRAAADAIVDQMVEKYGTSCSRAISILIDGIDDALRYLDFPIEHWCKISSTNPI
jgi:putative transposase